MSPRSFRIFSLCFCFLLPFIQMNGQSGETFVSLEGKAAIFSINETELSKTEIPAVHSRINFETKELVIHFQIENKNDSFPTESVHFKFKGIIELDRILTEGTHSSQNFLVPGIVEMNGITSVSTLEASKDHLGISDDINCRLIASIKFDPKEFKLSETSLNYSGEIRIEIILLIPEYETKL